MRPESAQRAGARGRVARGRRATLAAIVALAGTATVAAQPPRPRARIGVLLPGTPQLYAPNLAALREALAEGGRVEPATLELVVRYSDGANDRLPLLARELVAAEPEVIVTTSTPAIRAAMSATASIPIVFAAAADAVGSGLVASLARPGGHVTGLTLLIPDLAAKQFELLGEIVRGLQRVGVLRGRGEGAQAWETISGAVATRGATARLVEVERAEQIPAAFAELQAARSQALVVVDGPALNSHHATVARLAGEHRLPAMSTLRVYADAGLLAAYGPDIPAMWRRAAAHYVASILEGAKPAELPVQQPTSFELVLNLKTAAALGLTVPPAVLTRASSVIGL